MTSDQEKFAERGAPSFVWREGQERRLAMIRRWTDTEGTRILSDGCGVGMYATKLLADSPDVFGFDIEFDRALTANERFGNAHVAVSEKVPYPRGSFDVIISHEVLEHVQDDRQAVEEMARTLKVGGRAVIFVPNRWYPFETHGHYWRGQYHFGNTPLINYLPDIWRDKLAPHVKAYRWRDLKALIAGLPLRVVYHTRIFGGYDNIIARRPRLGKAIRNILYGLEKTPFRVLALSHLVILEKTG